MSADQSSCALSYFHSKQTCSYNNHIAIAILPTDRRLFKLVIKFQCSALNKVLYRVSHKKILLGFVVLYCLLDFSDPFIDTEKFLYLTYKNLTLSEKGQEISNIQ